MQLINQDHVDALEQQLDSLNENLLPLKDFILPGGSPAAAHCHLARTVARRAERRVISLAGEEPVNDTAVRYLNRLSDLLFVIARVLARENGGTEVLWEHKHSE
jgi:cob(I)alamin adenosyltransferase